MKRSLIIKKTKKTKKKRRMIKEYRIQFIFCSGFRFHKLHKSKKNQYIL